MQRLDNGRRAIFLDFDGTYADYGHVPEQHEAAVRGAREAGHVVMLCTGRPRCMITEEVLNSFDGIVGSAGGYVEIGGQVLADRRFDRDAANRAMVVLDRYDAAYLLEAPEAVYGLPGIDRRIAEIIGDRLGQRPEPADESKPFAALRMQPDLSRVEFAKITCFDTPVPIMDVAAEIGDDVAFLPLSIQGMTIDTTGEIYLPGVHKADGIATVIDHLGIDRSAVVAVGDGANDLEMLEFAGFAVAIEGSSPQLLALADATAAGPAQAGLLPAFTSLGLL
ncbi:MAG: HAD hydrolase family protein [Beutenbergiaceae bacterium]